MSHAHGGPPQEAEAADLNAVFLNGIWKQNPVFVQVLGMCPTLAVTNSVRNAIAMGIATLFVMVGSNTVIAAIRKIVPKQVRIATYIMVIATFVTMAEFLVKAISIPVYKALGPFLALIVSNCIPLGRAEAFAGRNPVGPSAMDGFSMGLGFCLALICQGTVREVLGAGTFLGYPLFGPHYQPWVLFLLPPGGFFTLAIWLFTFTWFRKRSAARKELAEKAKAQGLVEVHA